MGARRGRAKRETRIESSYECFLDTLDEQEVGGKVCGEETRTRGESVGGEEIELYATSLVVLRL